MRRNSFSDEKLRDYERTAKMGRIIFMPGPFGTEMNQSLLKDLVLESEYLGEPA